jgi:hypothetical protein
MIGTALLMTWVLLGTVITYRCQGMDCRSVRHIAPQQLSVFATPESCEAYRRALEQQQLPEVRSATRPDVSMKKQITYTCQPGGPL